MTQQLLLAVGGIVFFASIVGLVMALGATASDRQQVNRSLAALDALGPRRDEVRRELDRPFVERVLAPILLRLSRLGSHLSPRDETSTLRHRIDLAGNTTGWDVERILAFKVIGLVCGAAIGIAVPLALSGGLAVTAGVAVLLGPVGSLAPGLLLYQAAYNRNERIRRDLPD